MNVPWLVIFIATVAINVIALIVDAILGYGNNMYTISEFAVTHDWFAYLMLAFEQIGTLALVFHLYT